eukprot:8518233-Alexandrium_andersonii.AAC.1
MSASLVGSEMCIRDSVRSLGALEGQPPAAGFWRLSTGGDIAVAFNGCAACLLYTSDAADDM